MNKHILVVVGILISYAVNGQKLTNNFIYGSWIKCNVTSSDGSELPDDSPVKFTPIKYTFTKPDMVSVSLAYYDRGQLNTFELTDNTLTIKSPEGGFLNSLQVSASHDTLIIVQVLRNRPDNSLGRKYYMVREKKYQSTIPLKPSDIRSIKGLDTVYRQSQKIYAGYKGDSFSSYISRNVGENSNGERTLGHFVASFIVSELGICDSLKILESISPDFDKRATKVFNKAKKNWEPATLNGKKVKVQMIVEINYIGFDGMVPSYLESGKANEAYLLKDYDLAIYYYDQALKDNPNDKEDYFKRGMCKLFLGNKTGACEDWANAKALGGATENIDAVIAKYCR